MNISALKPSSAVPHKLDDSASILVEQNQVIAIACSLPLRLRILKGAFLLGNRCVLLLARKVRSGEAPG